MSPATQNRNLARLELCTVGAGVYHQAKEWSPVKPRWPTHPVNRWRRLLHG